MNKEIPRAEVSTEGLSDQEIAKADKDTSVLNKNYIKNRYFDLNVTATPYHSILQYYQKAKLAVFADIVPRTMLDFLVISEHPIQLDKNLTIPEIQLVYNNLDGD